MRFYDSESVLWKLSAIHPVERVWFWQRWFAAFREVDVTMTFERVGSYSVDDIRLAFRLAVEKDDDILTQHDSRDYIFRKLDEIKTISQAFRLYRWIQRDFTKAT